MTIRVRHAQEARTVRHLPTPSIPCNRAFPLRVTIECKRVGALVNSMSFGKCDARVDCVEYDLSRRLYASIALPVPQNARNPGLNSGAPSGCPKGATSDTQLLPGHDEAPFNSLIDLFGGSVPPETPRWPHRAYSDPCPARSWILHAALTASPGVIY